MVSGQSEYCGTITSSIQGDDESNNRRDRQNRIAYRTKLGRIVRKLDTSITRKLQDKYCLLKDILPNARFEDCARIVESYNKTYKDNQKKTTFIIGWHPKEEESHIHFYHTCSYNQSHCRCRFLNGFRFKHRRPSDVIREYSTDKGRTKNILEYLLSSPRQLFHIQIDDTNECLEIYRLEDLRSSINNVGNETRESLEMCEYEDQSSYRSREFDTESTNSNEGGGIERFINQRFEEISWSGNNGRATQRSDLISKLMRSLLHFMCTPIESACTLDCWVGNPNLIIYDSRNPDYQLAVSCLQRLTCSLDIHQLFKLHSIPGCKQIYSTRNSEHYYSIEESLEHCEELLHHQYGSNFVDFLQRLYEITEKIIPKKNSMFIHGR